MRKTLFEEYCYNESYILVELDSLSYENRKKFLRKLRNESNKINFFSTISELKFALFLDKEKIFYEYEPKLENNKKPDFKIRLKNETICYFDVKQFNISDTDRINNEFLFLLCNHLGNINKPYHIEVIRILDNLNINIDQASHEIEEWLTNPNIKLNDNYLYDNSILITVINTHSLADHILFICNPPVPKIHPSKIKSDIINKISRYHDTIIKHGIPFFIAIDLVIETLLDPEDYYKKFLDKNNGYLNPIQESFNTGYFFINNEFNDLTGILIRFDNKFYWIKNPNNQHRIEFNNVEVEYKM